MVDTQIGAEEVGEVEVGAIVVSLLPQVVICFCFSHLQEAIGF